MAHLGKVHPDLSIHASMARRQKNLHQSTIPHETGVASRAETRLLRAEVKQVRAGFFVCLTLSIGLTAWYFHHGVAGLLEVAEVDSPRFGYGVTNAVPFVAIPYIAAGILGIDLVRLRKRLRQTGRPQTTQAGSPRSS